MTDDINAISGEEGGYVPCNEVASPEADSVQDNVAIAGDDEGFVPKDTAASAADADLTDTNAVFGRGAAFVAKPCTECTPLDGLGTTWSETAGSLTAFKTPDSSGHDTPDTPQGTVTQHTAASGALDVAYEAAHLSTRTSLPWVTRVEQGGYSYHLAGISIANPDEFQVRGYIAAILGWPDPLPTPLGTTDIQLGAGIGLLITSGGYELIGIGLDRAYHAHSTGLVWTTTDSVRAQVWDTAGFTDLLAFPFSAGNFVLDRSVSRGTTQFWFNGNLMSEVALSVPRTSGALDLTVPGAGVNVQITLIPDIALSGHVELYGLLVCPSGTAIGS